MRPVLGKTAVFLAAVCGVMMLTRGVTWAAQSPKAPTTRTFTVVAVDIDTVQMWLPSTIVINQGDHVRLVLKNMMGGAPDVHGFAIPDYHIAELIPHGATKTVEFVADRAGIFPFICQIHAEHLGGQLIVNARKGD
jgi:nitrosocyanin